MNEYAFDVKLFAVVRVQAHTKEDAIQAMKKVVDAMQPTSKRVQLRNGSYVRVTEISLAEDGEDENTTPFEINGEPQ